ncbi:MAG: hypothetical protein H6Q43_943, partial [Deltaproteobacteria bacterium]|nr:hypothetical protein [Deltaproteobacteria bacterium]
PENKKAGDAEIGKIFQDSGILRDRGFMHPASPGLIRTEYGQENLGAASLPASLSGCFLLYFGFVKSPSVPLEAGLRCNFILAAPKGPHSSVFARPVPPVAGELFRKPSLCRLFTRASFQVPDHFQELVGDEGSFHDLFPLFGLETFVFGEEIRDGVHLLEGGTRPLGAVEDLQVLF